VARRCVWSRNLENEEAKKPATGLWKIQPQWVVTPRKTNKQTNNSHTYDYEICGQNSVIQRPTAISEPENEENSDGLLARPELTARTLKMGLHILDESVDWFSDVDNFMDRCLACKHEMEFYVHVTVHRNKFLLNKTNRRTIFFSNSFLSNSTCFGQFLCSSSGVFHCTFGTGIRHASLMTYTSAECTVENSWWWAEELPETFRISWQK
jgi:hypothetical protein